MKIDYRIESKKRTFRYTTDNNPNIINIEKLEKLSEALYTCISNGTVLLQQILHGCMIKHIK